MLPRKENDTFEMPPLALASGNFSRNRRTDSMKFTPYALCSSMPVATVRTFGSKMMSVGSKPTSSTRMRYARELISTLRSTVSACPCSSKAMTTTAAP